MHIVQLMCLIAEQLDIERRHYMSYMGLFFLKTITSGGLIHLKLMRVCVFSFSGNYGNDSKFELTLFKDHSVQETIVLGISLSYITILLRGFCSFPSS